jgi:catechol 2,3-dioxygenase-like lactoylglutathione lyase family enzyme
MKSLFHLAYHVTDLDAVRSFFGSVLGCREGRSTETWVDFDFFGHQISLHLGRPFEVTRTGRVGDHGDDASPWCRPTPRCGWSSPRGWRAPGSHSTSRLWSASKASLASSEPCFFSIRVEIQLKSKA